VITSVLLWAPLLRLGMGLLENVHVAPAGRPEHEPSDTDCGITPVGVTVTVYVAWFPAVTVCELGAA